MLPALIVLLCALFATPVAARPALTIAKRDRIADDDKEAFLLERKDPNFACKWTDNPRTGRRAFWCPSPCRLSERVGRAAGEELRPINWQCPPTVKNTVTPKDSLCRWKRSGRLQCPNNCGWERDDEESAYIWTCATSTVLRSQTQQERQQFLLGWRSGPIDRVELDVRSSYLCPANELACPLSAGTDIGATLTPAGSFECINSNDTLEHCGGCATVPGSGGVDCSSLKGGHYACVSAQCEPLHCHAGFVLNLSGNACVENHGHTSL